MLAMPDAAFALGFAREWYIVEPTPGPDAPALFTELFSPIR